MIGTHLNEKQEERPPSKLFPIICIIAGLLFGLAVLVMVYKLQIQQPGPFSRAPECPSTERWERRADEANSKLQECLERPPRVKIVEVAAECPELPNIEIPECPAFPEIPSCPQYDPPECEECSRSYKNEFQQCMEQKGDLQNQLNQCGNDDGALEACKRKTKELRRVISTLTLNQRSHCPRVAVRGCEKEITAACGHLREALEFYFDKSKSQPGSEDDEGFANGMAGLLKPGAIVEDDSDFEELDLDE